MTFQRDLRLAMRSLAGRPGFTFLAVLSLGLGIGLNAAVFTWFKAVYLDPLPAVKDARTMITINAASRERGGLSNSYADFRYIREYSGVFDGLFAHETETVAIGAGESAELIEGGIVSANYFDVLRIKMSRGQGFKPEEEQSADQDPVVVLSFNTWQTRYGEDPDILGRRIVLNRKPFTVIGVAEPGFAGVYGGVRQNLWVPLYTSRIFDSHHRRAEDRGSWLQVMGRPKPGVLFEHIQAALDLLSAQLRISHPADHSDYLAEAFPLHRSQRGFHASLFEPIRVLAFASGLILVLACLNVANLLFARATERSREISIRLSLGGGRWRVLQQLFTESLLIAGIGALIGLLLALWSQSLPAILFSADSGVFLNTDFDWRVLGFLLAVSCASALAFGLLPGAEAIRVDLAAALKQSSTGVTSAPRLNYWRRSLVVVQVALSLAVLTGALLIGQHLMEMVHTDRGFRAENVLTAELDLLAAGIQESRGREMYVDMMDELQQFPQVESAAWTTFLPMSGSGGGNRRSLEVPGYADPRGKPLAVIVDSVTPGFFRTLDIPILAGRDFERLDNQNASPVAIVNEEFARVYLGGKDPVGAKVRIGQVWRTIVGLHRDYVYRSPSAAVRPTALLPLAQDYDPRAILVMRTKNEPNKLAASLRQVIGGTDSYLQPRRILTMEENVALQFAEIKIAGEVIAVFGLLASALAAIGLYGVLSAFVAQRRRELAIRMSLGAAPAHLCRIVVAQSARLTLIGIGIGLIVSAALGLGLQSSLPGLAPFSPFAYAAAILGVCCVSLVSTFVPSRRAGRTDPIVVLRQD